MNVIDLNNDGMSRKAKPVSHEVIDDKNRRSIKVQLEMKDTHKIYHEDVVEAKWNIAKNYWEILKVKRGPKKPTVKKSAKKLKA